MDITETSNNFLTPVLLSSIINTRVLVHVVRGDSEDPVGDFIAINQELELFNPKLALKTQVIPCNDLLFVGVLVFTECCEYICVLNALISCRTDIVLRVLLYTFFLLSIHASYVSHLIILSLPFPLSFLHSLSLSLSLSLFLNVSQCFFIISPHCQYLSLCQLL